MLRSNLQLTGDMELYQLLEEGILLVCQQVVEADAGPDKDLLHTGDLPELPQQGHIVAMVRLHILAGGGVQALPSAAGTLGQLLFAGGSAEIGGGTAHIVDVALEILVLHDHFRFPEDGFVAPGLDNPALVEGQGAEGAGTEAAPVGNQAEFDLFNGGNTALFGIAGMPGPLVGQLVYRIHFLGGQGLLRGILHHIFLAIGLG